MGRPGEPSNSTIENPALSPLAEHLPRMAELMKAYQRIDETIRANNLNPPVRIESGAFQNPIDTLSRSLGLSISAFEIAHRGVGSNPFSTSLLGDIPEQHLTHFRIMSETIESYLAVHVIRPSPIHPVGMETLKKRAALTAHLLGAEAEITMIHVKDAVGNLLFQDDNFLFFVDWLSFFAPNVGEAFNVMTLCFWAEVVKTVFVYKRLINQYSYGTPLQDVQTGAPINPDFEAAVNAISMEDTADPFSRVPVSKERVLLMRHLVERYALAFLRKCIIVMFVRYGLDFECPYNVDPESPELQRLTALLHMPPLDELCSLYTTQTPEGEKLRLLTKRWISQASMIREHESIGAMPIKLPHPAIFELVGLPKNYDALTEEAIKHKCPTTHKEIVDPAVCLLCGDIFCSQAVCCMKDKNKGGCHQHMKKCGGKVGVFINIRKCMVLFMHGPGNGSFAHAPYLDKHGEPDPTLRRHHQLFLNQRRYDKLMREVWLLHQIPTVISRKLEADINTGGWETL
jgi:E3 ubiquitin-protein ligase UBR1